MSSEEKNRRSASVQQIKGTLINMNGSLKNMFPRPLAIRLSALVDLHSSGSRSVKGFSKELVMN